MGMNDMFVQFKADFTDLSKEIPGEPLYVTNVAHIAYIDVNEAGVEAGGVASKFKIILACCLLKRLMPKSCKSIEVI